jgi:glucose-1-phosphate adenylyltransferase
MDSRQMVEQHIASGAGVTVAGIRVPRSEATAFGVIETGPDGRRITQFLEKPANPPSVPDDPDVTYASMGNYVFSTEALLDALRADAEDPTSVHDMGGNIIPMLVAKGDAEVYDFKDNEVPGSTERDRGYWRDVGTLDSYYDAHMDLVSLNPIFNLYNRKWPILTSPPQLAPAKFVLKGSATESIVSAGCIVTGRVHNSILSAGTTVAENASVSDSVILHNVKIGEGAVVKRAILDKNVVVPDGVEIGVDLDRDRQRYRVTDSGIVVLGKGQRVVA